MNDPSRGGMLPSVPMRRNRRWPWLLTAALGATSLGAVASTPQASGWSADCQTDAHRFRVVFTPTAAPDPADPARPAEMRATLVRPDRPELLLPLSRTEIRARPVVATPASACTGLGAFLLKDQIYLATPPVLLLWLSVADRPGWDQLSLVLIDLEKGTVLDQSEFVAPIKDPDGTQGLHIQPATDHARVRLQRRWLHHTGTDSPDNAIEGWYRVEVRAGQIRGRWEAE